MSKADAEALAQHTANKQNEDVYVVRCKYVGYTIELKSQYERAKSNRTILAVKQPEATGSDSEH